MESGQLSIKLSNRVEPREHNSRPYVLLFDIETGVFCMSYRNDILMSRSVCDEFPTDDPNLAGVLG